MEPDPQSSAEPLRAHARAIRAASQQLRARARELRESSRRRLADTAVLRSRLGSASQPRSTDGRQPRGSTPDERSRVRASSAAAASIKTDGMGSLTSLGALLEQVAQTLERSARLAEEHAAREHAAGRPASADRERLAARRARDAAARGHDLARRHNPTDPPGDSAEVSNQDDTGGRADENARPRSP